jgi:signal transduction histidine kinase
VQQDSPGAHGCRHTSAACETPPDSAPAVRDLHDRNGRRVPRAALFDGLNLGTRCRKALKAAGVRSAKTTPPGPAGPLGPPPASDPHGCDSPDESRQHDTAREAMSGELARAHSRFVRPASQALSRAVSRLNEWTASPSAPVRYAVAIAVVVLAAAVTLPLWQEVFSRNPFALFYAAVVVAAWFGGFGPGLLATLLAVLAIDDFILPSFISLRRGWNSAVHVGGFMFVALLVSSLEATRKRAMKAMRSAKEAAELSARTAESANRAKDQFLAVLSHELRTPLTPALAAASAMEADPGLPAGARGELGMVRRNIELEARLIDDLLDLTRITRGKLPLARQTVDLHALIGHVASICRMDLREKGLSFHSGFAPGERPYVNVDPARLRQVLWNVLKNAIKFTPAGGSVTLRTRVVSDGDASGGVHPQVVVEVSDTGIGIEPDILPRIFDAFEQGDRANSHRFGGLGLGLAISRALAVAHGGELTAASEGAGRGATFSLRLPLVAKPANADDAARAARAWPPTPPPAAVRSPPDGTGAGDAGAGASSGAAAAPRPLRVLLVEDHADTARVMARLLRGERYDVTCAETVEAALGAVAGGPFDLIISDLGLPDGSGLDLMRELREERHFGGRAIALSGYGMEEDLRRSREAGFAAHLTKPVSFAALEAVIREVTEA